MFEFPAELLLALPWIGLTLAIWLAQYLVRRYLPRAWEVPANVPFGSANLAGPLKLLRKVWQGLPSVLAGALAGAYLSGTSSENAWKGALAGALAPVWHELLKALPGPYDGGSTPPPPPAVRDGDTLRIPRAPRVPLFGIALLIAACLPGPAGDASAEVCAKESGVALARCERLALERCGGKTADACAEYPAVEAECHRIVDEELAKCPSPR